MNVTGGTKELREELIEIVRENFRKTTSRSHFFVRFLHQHRDKLFEVSGLLRRLGYSVLDEEDIAELKVLLNERFPSVFEVFYVPTEEHLEEARRIVADWTEKNEEAWKKMAEGNPPFPPPKEDALLRFAEIMGQRGVVLSDEEARKIIELNRDEDVELISLLLSQGRCVLIAETSLPRAVLKYYRLMSAEKVGKILIPSPNGKRAEVLRDKFLPSAGLLAESPALPLSSTIAGEIRGYVEYLYYCKVKEVPVLFRLCDHVATLVRDYVFFVKYYSGADSFREYLRKEVMKRVEVESLEEETEELSP